MSEGRRADAPDWKGCPVMDGLDTHWVSLWKRGKGMSGKQMV